MSSHAELASSLTTESQHAPAALLTNVASLRTLRLAKGLSLDDVAVRLKFSTKYIEALEAGQFESLPRGLALKGIVKNYARLLGTDSKELEASLQSQIGSVTGGIAAHTSTRSLGAHEAQSSSSSGSPIWLLVIFSVVIAAISVAIWQGIVPQSWVPAWLGTLFK
jgi:cytoskeletal protein RodZ